MAPTPEQLANRRAWLAALRSGNYRQAWRTLRRNDSYCCLGVAEDVTDCEWRAINVWGEVATHAATRDASDLAFTDVDSALTSLTYGACAALGLDDRVPRVAWRNPATEDWQVTTLVRLNDHVRLNFVQIAAVIEDQGEDWSGDFAQAAALVHRWQADGRPASPWTR